MHGACLHIVLFKDSFPWSLEVYIMTSLTLAGNQQIYAVFKATPSNHCKFYFAIVSAESNRVQS